MRERENERVSVKERESNNERGEQKRKRNCYFEKVFLRERMKGLV